MLNGHDICHGGLIFTLADSTFAYACNSRNLNTVAAGCSIEFLKSGKAGDVLTCEGVERVLQGRHGIYDMTVTNQDGEVVAMFRGKSTQIKGNVIQGRHEEFSAGADRESRPRRAEGAAVQAPAGDAAPRVRQLAGLSREVRRGRRGAGRLPLARGPREVSVHDQARPARPLSLRHVRGAARADACASMRPAAPRASPRWWATRRTTSTPGRA